MAKYNISFNNKDYSIDESSLSSATAALKSHLSTVMNGSGATINLGGTAYSIDSAKLSAATNAFVSHLVTVAGSGYKVVISGGEGYAFEPIVWNGNIEGKEKFTVKEGVDFYKVADDYPELNQIDSLCIYRPSTDGEFVEQITPVEALGFNIKDNGGNLNELLMFSDGSYNYISTFPKGIWMSGLMMADGIVFKLLPKITITPTAEYGIDATKLAGAVGELETVLGSLNSGDDSDNNAIVWDGSIEGRDTAQLQYGQIVMRYVKLCSTDACSVEELNASTFSAVNSVNGETISGKVNLADSGQGAYGDANSGLQYFPESGSFNGGMLTIPSEGLYLLYNMIDGDGVEQIAINHMEIIPATN